MPEESQAAAADRQEAKAPAAAWPRKAAEASQEPPGSLQSQASSVSRTAREGGGRLRRSARAHPGAYAAAGKTAALATVDTAAVAPTSQPQVAHARRASTARGRFTLTASCSPPGRDAPRRARAGVVGPLTSAMRSRPCGGRVPPASRTHTPVHLALEVASCARPRSLDVGSVALARALARCAHASVAARTAVSRARQCRSAARRSCGLRRCAS